MKRWIILSVIGLLVVAAAIFAAIESSRIAVQTAVVERSSIEVFLDERGKTRLPKTYEITMPYSGRVDAIDLEVGDSVSVGGSVAQISEEDLRSEVARAQAVVDRLDAAIEQNDDTRLEVNILAQANRFVESMAFTEEAAVERVQASQFRMNYAETVLGRLQELLDADATSQDRVDVAQLQFDEARKGYTQDNLICRATSAIRAATDLLPNMVQDEIDKKSLSRAVLEKQRNEANAVLSDALTRQERGTLRSPVDGVVLERDYHAEQYLAAGTRLLAIGNLDELEIETDILSQDAVRIRTGDPVEIYGPATGRDVGAGFRGEVLSVYPSGFSKLSTLGVEQQRVKVIISIGDEDRSALVAAGLGVDYRVRVRIFTDSKSDALVIPRVALFRSPQGEWQTFVVRNGKVRLSRIKVGLINDRWAEVIEGLESEDQVVVAPESSLRDGERVRAVSP